MERHERTTLSSPVGGKSVRVAFDGGRLTSDAGVLVLAEVERRLGITERLARCLPDPRAGFTSSAATSRKTVRPSCWRSWPARRSEAHSGWIPQRPPITRREAAASSSSQARNAPLCASLCPGRLAGREALGSP